MTAETKPRKPRVVLSPRDKFRLIEFTLATYTSSRLNDPEFAVLATEKLAIVGVNDNHIKGIRSEFEILANNRVAVATAVPGAVSLQMHEDVLHRLSAAEAQIRKLFADADDLRRNLTAFATTTHARLPPGGM